MIADGKLLREIRAHLAAGSDVILASEHLDVATLEAAPSGPARRTGESDQVTIALRGPYGAATLTLPAHAGNQVDPRAAAASLQELAKQGAVELASWPAVKSAAHRERAWPWRRVISSWEPRVEQTCARLRPGESVTVSLERTRTEILDPFGRRRETLRQRAAVRVIVPARGRGHAGWDMTVPVVGGRRTGISGALNRARLHATLRAAPSGERGATVRAGAGRLILGPVAVAEALARWCRSADARRGRRPGIAGVVAPKRAGDPRDRLLDAVLGTATASAPVWRLAIGDARRSGRETSLRVAHVEAWLPGPDEEAAAAVVAGFVGPRGAGSAIHVDVSWSRLEAAIRSRHRRGPRLAGVHLAGRDIEVPWLDLGFGRWSSSGRAPAGNVTL